MPLDILHEVRLLTRTLCLIQTKLALPFIQIVEHLHQIDLYHISCTNRSFQDILRIPSSTSFWRVSYEREHEIPRCPSDILELEWADLLFRKQICQVSLVCWNDDEH